MMRGRYRPCQAAMMIMSTACVLLPCRQGLTEEHAATSDKLAGKRPNILFIMSDDHAQEAIGAYGSWLKSFLKTPTLDQLAAEGVRFNNLCCCNSICSPSRASIITGQYSHTCGGYNLGCSLLPAAPSYNVELKKAGYQTAIIGKWHMGHLPRGMDFYAITKGQGSYFNPTLRFADGTTKKQSGYYADVYTDTALGWLKQRDRSKPFCLNLQFKGPHHPYDYPERHGNLLQGTNVAEPASLHEDIAQTSPLLKGTSWSQLYSEHAERPYYERHESEYSHRSDDPKERRSISYQHMIHKYIRCVAAIDDNVKRVLDVLRREGQLENTIVVYTSDQGYWLGQHGLYDKRLILEESLKMPLIVRYPKEIEAQTVCDSLCSNVDIAPTLLDFAGVVPPAEMQGRSMRPLMKGQTPQDWRKAIWYAYYARSPLHWGVRTDRYKLVKFPDTDQFEFYDLDKDPSEMQNLAANPDYAAAIADVETQLAKTVAEVGVQPNQLPGAQRKEKKSRKRTTAEVAGQLPNGVKDFRRLQLESGKAYRRKDSVIIEIEKLPEDRKFHIPRMANVVKRIRWIGSDPSSTMTMWPEVDHWVINLSPPPKGDRLLLELQLGASPLAFNGKVVAAANDDGVISLPAKFATTHGEKLRFEPQPHKNTVGYWAVEKDFAEWRLKVDQAGTFDVEILQGCGKGHGGSKVELLVGDQKLTFNVLETGHFQNFRWRHLGQIRLNAADNLSLKLVPVKKVAGAVMDCREIRLVPAKQNDVSLRRTGRNADGTRADGREVQSTRPNVLVILTDDQGTLDAGCYGSRDLFTPRIDGLANDGVRFTQAYSHTVCCPARAMLMTGRHPQRSGVNSWTQGDLKSKPGINMHDREVTIAEALKSAGYRTALFGKWHLGAAATSGPTTQGFDEFFGHRGGFIDNYNHFFLHGNGFHDLYRGTKEVHKRGQYFPDMTVAETKRFISDHIANYPDKPFFTYLAFNIPHYPEQGDSRFDQFYARTKMPRQSYGRMITTVDDRIGQVLEELDRLGVRDNTIVIFQSDNGASAEDYQIKGKKHLSGLKEGSNYGANGGGGNTGKWRGHKNTFYEGGLRVPAIISFPKALPSAETRDQAVTLCDWMPTILDLCDVAPSQKQKLDGASLLPIIRNNAESHHNVLHWQWQKRWAVREGDWKLIGHQNGSRELVNLADKEPETINHAKQEPAIVARLQKLHDDWAAEVRPK